MFQASKGRGYQFLDTSLAPFLTTLFGVREPISITQLGGSVIAFEYLKGLLLYEGVHGCSYGDTTEY